MVLSEPLLACARAEGVEERKVRQLDLALEEILINIVYYSYKDCEEIGDIEISGWMDTETESPMFVVEVVDSGKHFDLTVEAAYPNISANIDERKIGGLGIFLVKKLMGLVEYQRKDGKNILRIGINR